MLMPKNDEEGINRYPTNAKSFFFFISAENPDLFHRIARASSVHTEPMV